MPRVLIIERDPIARALMAQYLSNSEPYPLASAVGTWQEALPLLSQTEADILLLDVCEGCLLSDIKRQFPQLKVIVTLKESAPLPPQLRKSLAADSLWVKEPSPASLLAIMDKTMAGEGEFPILPPMLLGAVDCDTLTQRELEVLQELVNGKTDAAIGEALNMSVPTVKYHISNIREKTKLTSRTELAVCAVECGLVRRTL